MLCWLQEVEHRPVLLCQKGLMAYIDPEAIKILGQERSEKLGLLQKCSPRALSNCPVHWRASGSPVPELRAPPERAWPAAETQETELVKLGKEVESDFKFI